MKKELPGELYFYTFAPVLALAAGASTIATVTVDKDGDFLMTDIMGHAVNAGGSAVDFLLSIRDDLTSRGLTNRFTLSRLICTNAQTINPLPVRRLFRGASTVTVEISNPTAAAMDVYISLRGMKVPSGTVGQTNLTGPAAG
jgi:hypothetical protein